MKKTYIILLGALVILLSGCKKEYLESMPTSSVAEADLFSTVTGANTALNGMHRSTFVFQSTHDRFGQKTVDMAMDLLGEDFYQSERGYGWFVGWYQYIEHRNINSGNLEYVWAYYYDLVDNANGILANIDKANDLALNTPLATNIKAQALVYRAFSHYQLVQLYASRYAPGAANTHLGIPILIKQSQEGLERSTVAQVYVQILADLDAAIAAFGQSATALRVNKSHININVAKGIKARVALTMGSWAVAETMASEARTGYSLSSNYAFGWNKATDSEWMWGALLIDEQQTSYASFFSHIDPAFGGYAALGNHKLASTAIFNFMSATDTRKSVYKTSSNKPRVGWKFSGAGGWTNDYLFMKAGEMYLIEAESQARQGKEANAQTTIFNLISKRDPAYVKPVLTGDALLQHILMQRRCELWGEGFRFLDIKRLNLDLERHNLGHTETLWDAAGYFPAGDKNFVFLIPKQEIDANPKIVQNPL